MKRAELLKDPLKTTKVIENYMSCKRCKYQEKCIDVLVSGIPVNYTRCGKIWFDAFIDGTEDLESKNIEQMTAFFSEFFRCNCCPIVECEFNTIGHDGCCVNHKAIYRWLNEDVTKEARRVNDEEF